MWCILPLARMLYSSGYSWYTSVLQSQPGRYSARRALLKIIYVIQMIIISFPDPTLRLLLSTTGEREEEKKKTINKMF